MRFLFITILLFFSANYCINAQGTYRDEFNAVSYTNNDGSENWTAGWTELDPNSGANGDPAGGFVQITGNRLRFNRIANNAEQIQRTADLSAATSAILSFDWETTGIDAGELMDIEISSTGVPGSFTVLDRFGDGVNVSDTFNRDISAFISANTTIRFVNNGASWTANDDTFFADNIQLELLVPDLPPEISVTGNQNYCPSSTDAIPIAQTVSITDPDDSTIEQVTVQISTGYQNGQDLLTLTGVHPNITDAFNAVEGRLILTGPATLAEFEAAVLAVTFSTIAPFVTGLREFSIVLGSPFFLPETGHYYEFIPALNIRWDTARDQATLRTFFGLQGYLATLTSVIESNFAGAQITGTGWIGATDRLVEGEWRWETGPEAGTLFWVGDENGAVVPGEFSFWNNNEPNDFPNDAIDGEENYAHIKDDRVGGIQNSWNDLPVGGSGGFFQAQGYVVEYGGLPGDPVLDISGVTQISVACTVITNRKITDRVSQ